MPKELKEIRNFNQGTLLNASERDIPDNASAFSLNINPLAEHGILSAIKNDKLFASSGNLFTTLSTPISWGGAGFHDVNQGPNHLPIYGHQLLQVDNIDFANDADTIRLKAIGTKGKTEYLTAHFIRPWMEKVFHTYNSMDVTFETSAEISKDALEISYLTDTNTITRGTITSDSVYTISGFSGGSATIVSIHATASEYDTGTLVITSPDGRVITYIFDDDDDGATGTTDVSGNVRIQLNSISGQGNIAAEIKEAIESANGHGGRISIVVSTTTVSNDTLTLTYNHLTMDNYIFADDYIAFTKSDITGLKGNHEIIKIESVDTVNNKFLIKRGCFGSEKAIIEVDNTYFIYANKITIPNSTTAGEHNSQITTKKGYFQIHKRDTDYVDSDFDFSDVFEWSRWSGNNLGGNSSYLYANSTANQQARYCGTIDTNAANQSMVFDADAKTVTFGSAVSVIPFAEGETVTFYQDVDNGANNGFSAKIVKKVEASTGCVITLDTAPTSETESAQIYYMEANLLKNHTFHHQVDQTAPAQTIDDAQQYKINHWSHEGYREDQNNVITNEYGYGGNTTDANVVQIDTGGFWTTSNGLRPLDDESDNPGIPADGAADQDALFYPNAGADKYMRMISEFVLIGDVDGVTSRNNTSVLTTDTQIFFTESVNDQPAQLLAKNDVIRMTNEVTWEYMRVVSIEGSIVTIERAIWGTTALSFTNGPEQKKVYKCVNHGLQQKVSKDLLKPNQQYVLSFYAQDEDSNFTVANCDKTLDSATVDLDDGAETGNPIVPGMLVTGTGVPTGTTVDSVTSTTQFEMSQLASNGTSVTLTFYNPGQGGLSLRMNGGYIKKDGRFDNFSNALNKGYVGKNTSNITTEERWINFKDIYREYGDTAVDVNGDSKENTLDGQWRKLSFTFTTPKRLLTDLTIDFASMGPHDSKIAIDLADLRENTVLINVSNVSSVSTTSILDNSGVKDLIFWDDIKGNMGYINDVFQDSYDVQTASYGINTSPYTSTELSSSKQTFIANNREMHVGLGSKDSDSSPQWIGYVNNKVFGQDYSNQLYQDEDTIHQYASGSAGSLSKICVAGEHEKLEGTLASVGSELSIVHAGNGLKVGDNIIVREWGDVGTTWAGAGVWSVTAEGSTITCERLASLDADPANDSFFSRTGGTDRTSTTGYVCYRPYYYYGIRDGDYHIYRITPSDKINDAASDTDPNYPAGTIERSQPLRAPLASICTCHSKEDESSAGFGGGRVYVMSNISGDIYAVNVQVNYDAWKTTVLSDSIIHPEFKSFKWSNDNINGDIGGTTEVFPDAGLAAASSPTIATTGIMSDILETKGPNASYIHAADGVDDNDPDHFDTRLWIQFRPAGEDTFGEGARYLFCGKTNNGNSGVGTEATIYFADRTPPSNVLFGLGQSVGPSVNPHVVSGLTSNNTQGLTNHHPAFTGDWSKYSYFSYWRYLYWSGIYIEHLGIKNGPDSFGSWGDYNSGTGTGIDFPYIQWGYNTGWSGTGGRFPAVKVAKYGLVPMADNDNDGVIDGTGVVVPSTTSVAGSTKNPYGNLHQRVSAHAVGLIGGSEVPWIRSGGKSQCGQGTNFWQGGSEANADWNNGNHADMPEDLEVEKCLFICSDMHYGDFQPPAEVRYTSVANVSHNGQNLGRFLLTTAAEANFYQAGDCVYVQSDDGSTFKTGATVMGVETGDPAYLTIDIYNPGTVSDAGTIYTHTPKGGGYARSSANHRTDNHGVAHVNHQMFHYSFDKDTPTNGDIFTEGDACGHYNRTWYSKPNVPYGVWSYMPGILSKIERLDYRAGFMIRPFEATENTFEDLVIGNNTAIDIPSMPDHVYHVKDSTYLHKHVNDDVVNNQFASRMYISSEANLEGETNKSKIYMCDLNLTFPHIGNHQALDNLGSAGGTTDDYNEIDSWDILASGTLKGTPYIYASTGAQATAGATQHPVILFTSGATNCNFGEEIFQYRGYTGVTGNNDDGPLGHRNGLAGLCLSIVDKDTGTTQTRYIVSSHSAGTSDTDHAYVGVHYPFGHIPVEDDTWYITHHSNICTAPVRLLKEVELEHSAGTALKADPTLSAPIYKNTGVASSTLSSDGELATFTCDVIHNLTTNDKVTISCPADSNYDGTYQVTVTSPKIFTFTTSGSDLTDLTTATWTLVTNEEQAPANPIKLDIAAPTLKTMFGGLDLRKLRGGEVSAIADDTDDIRLTGVNHRLSVGDTVTYKSDSVTAQNGTYVVKEGDGALPSATEDTFDVENTTHTDEPGDWTTNQWESLLSERGSTSRIGELRSGFNSWDKGNIQSNVIRYDTDDNSSSFMSVSESGIVVQASSIGSASGDYFTANTIYSYKISFIYDGYQEGPLSEASWNFEDSITRGKLGIKLKITDYSRRLSHVCLYRRDSASDFYKLVEQVSTASGWAYDGTSYIRQVEDDGTVGASYSARTGLSEVLDTIRLKYGISAEIDGYLFAGDCSHSRIKNSSNMVFRSRPGMFSIFDYANDFLTLKSKPTALANFNGRLYVFDSKNIYKVNQGTLQIEDIFEGVGCLNKDALIVTEYGMFFADKNGAYMHNGSTPTKISESIQQAGDTSTSFEVTSSDYASKVHNTGTTDNIKDVSWESLVTNEDISKIQVTFIPRTSSVLFTVNYTGYTDLKGLSFSDAAFNDSFKRPKTFQYIWSYNVPQKRWDLWELSEDSTIGKPFLGDSGELYMPIGESIYEYGGGSSNKDYTWISKRLSMDEDSTGKVFNKVKINGLSTDLNGTSVFKESSQRLIVTTSSGTITAANTIYSSESSDHSTYRITGANKKGRWVQFKLEDMTESIDSVGILFRRKGKK